MEHVHQQSRLLQMLEAFTKGSTTVKEAIYLLQSANDQLPPGQTQQAIQQKIKEAERAIQFGHAEMGQSLGLQFCHCTWPPQLMKSSGYSEETHVDQFTCPNCGKSLSHPHQDTPSEKVTVFDPYDDY